MRLVKSPFSNAKMCEEMGLISLTGIAALAGVNVRIIAAARNQGMMPTPKLTSPSGNKKLWDREGIGRWLRDVDLESFMGLDDQRPWRETENPVLRQTKELFKAINITRG
jgi:hypothetical protein